MSFSPSINVDEVKYALVAMGFEDVRREPSVVQCSLHDYVYVYLTDRGPEGSHVIVSDRREYDANASGYIVGRYEHYEDDNRHVEEFASLGETLYWVRKNCGRNMERVALQPAEREYLRERDQMLYRQDARP